jgi:hypothetical protein
MVIKDANFTEVKYGSIEQDGDSNIAVFTFPSGFSYDRRYDIVVIPTYAADDVHTDLVPGYEVNQPRPLALRVTGDFYFDGKCHIDANDATVSGGDKYLIARCGGFPGPKGNSGEPTASVFNDHTTAQIPTSSYWTLINCPTSVPSYSQTHARTTGPGALTGKYVVIPTDRAKTVFGPGQPAGVPYKSGAGASYGGQGGNSGRAYMFGIESAYGLTYGDTRIPFPFGGSAGGWGSSTGGTGGGGGIEIIATGNVTLDTHAEITANGGAQVYPAAVTYAAGGASGGSVKIIAGGTFTNNGLITADGGCGGNASGQANNTGGGGSGGRIAINAASTPVNNGTIEAIGGLKGYYVDSGINKALAENGAAGTVLLTTDSPKIASAPLPKNGDTKAYIGGTKNDPCTGFVLSWYSGYGATNDRVWMGTSSTNLVVQGSAGTVATRGKHSITVSVNKNKTYYWQVKTDNNSISSDMWSFTTVSWVCPLAVDYGVKHHQITFVPGLGGDDSNNSMSGPEWDHNRDCVLNDADFWYFAKDWQDTTLNNAVAPPGYPGIVNMRALRRFAVEWLDCYARTNNGCNGFGF